MRTYDRARLHRALEAAMDASSRENWTVVDAERAIARAQRLFDRYERVINFERPSKSDQLYHEFLSAKERAIDISRVVGVKSLMQQAVDL